MKWEGWNVGSVTLRRVQLDADGDISIQSHRHGGDISSTILDMLEEVKWSDNGNQPAGAAITGALATSIFSLPYIPEPVCVELALQALKRSPDMVLSLGGESFIAYCMKEGQIRNMLTSSRCAAGSGEFIIQQFGRMGVSLEEGMNLASKGKHVSLASRCSVHIKSDATHKLNKGECSPSDIAHTLIVDLAGRIFTLIESTSWKLDHIIVSGGMALNELLLDTLRKLLPESLIEILPESSYLEAFGAAIAASRNGNLQKPLQEYLLTNKETNFESMPPLSSFTGQVTRLPVNEMLAPTPDMQVLLGIDAGSTTTKATIVEFNSGKLIAAVYLRTHGNPVYATSQCLDEIKRQIGDCPLKIVQTSVTGSGRDLVSVAMGNCLSFNEILTHARAAREAHPDVDTIFEIGGQDAKFISLLEEIPVDYSMNDGCSAGTGSFLEEVSASDMKVQVNDIGRMALEADAPMAFGERCAAFINSEIRTALQTGADAKNIVAGLVYSISKNYLSRVVGTRSIGSTVILQGGVALNPAMAPAMASLTGRKVIVPQNPELMGCIGSALMARDLIYENKIEKLNYRLEHFRNIQMQNKESFHCGSCKNKCEIQRIQIYENTFPFGGLCSRWEMQRRPKNLRHKEGVDLVSLRSKLMFETFAPLPVDQPHARVGLPLALTTHELYPFYARLLTELGFEVVISRSGKGRRNTHSPLCYPAELLHAAIDDLFEQDVDWIFYPQIREFSIPDGHTHGYTCSFSEDSGSVIKEFFIEKADRFLMPEIGFSEHLKDTSESEICRMAEKLGIPQQEASRAYRIALQNQSDFEAQYRKEGMAALSELHGPIVIMVGRPYSAYTSSVNLSLPRKIASRGFNVIPADMLPFNPSPNERNVWHFTQVALSAVEYTRQRKDAYICYLSCYSCNPDAIIYHSLRHELEGQPFCFLEIDSHTADAGIDTRVGAFLDIIEERREMDANPAIKSEDDVSRGRIDFRNHKPKIITDSGEIIGFDHPKVVHVLIADTPIITSRLFVSLYGRMGWRCKITPFTDAKTLQAARQVCSGRECLPFLAMAGKMVRYLEQRDPDEITVFHLLEQEGPCQIGNWFDAAANIFHRLGKPDVVCAWPAITNNYLGGGEKVAIMAAIAGTLGDLFGEIRSSMRCLANDPQAALKMLDEMEDRLIVAAERGLPAIEKELNHIQKELVRIPIKGNPKNTPKVLLFSGINRIFVDKPIRDFFEQRGILAKTGDIGEFLCFYETEPIIRKGFAQDRRTPDQAFDWRTLLAGVLKNPDKQVRFQAVRARIHVKVIEMLDHRWRKILSKTGLVYAPDINYRELMRNGHECVSFNGWTEASSTAGRYITSLEEDVFDGYVNIGAFNCTPASAATAAVHNISITSKKPYAVIECDGANITASQLRQLESIAVRCWEMKGKQALSMSH